MGRGAPDVDPAAVPEVSLLPAAGDQALWARQQVVTLSAHTTEGGKVSSSKSELSREEEDVTGEDENAEADKGGVETSSHSQVASDGKEGQECISQVFGRHEDTDPEPDPGEKTQPIQ